MFLIDSLIDQIKSDYPFKSRPKINKSGVSVIGYIRAIDLQGINAYEADFFLKTEVIDLIKSLYEQYKWFGDLPDKMQNVIIELKIYSRVNETHIAPGFYEFMSEQNFYLAAVWLRQWLGNESKIISRLIRILSNGKLN